MKLKLTKPVVVKGFPGIAVGDVIEVSERFASELLAEGIAAPVETIQNRDPIIENRDPETQPSPPSKRTRAK